MKMFLKIIKYRFMSSLKHPVVLVCLLLALTSAIFVGVYSSRMQNDSALYPIAIVDEDGGEFAEMFIDSIEKNEQVDALLMSREKAIRQVSVGRVDGAFILLDGFTEKLHENDFSDIVEFISPSVTTSAYPVSEIVSSEIVDIWLMNLVQNVLLEMYDDLGDSAVMEYDEVLENLDKDYAREDIISIKYIGDNKVVNESNDTEPIDRAVGVYAAFVLFAVFLSGEWIFNIKKRGLQSRFISSNANLSMVCLASQLASVALAMMFFIPLVVFFAVYLSIELLTIIYLIIGMFLFLLCICSMAFIVSIFVENLTQLVVVGTSLSIINILISSLAMPLPDWASAANSIAKAFPGTYLLGCYSSMNKLLSLIMVTLIWTMAAYFCTLYMRKKARA